MPFPIAQEATTPGCCPFGPRASGTGSSGAGFSGAQYSTAGSSGTLAASWWLQIPFAAQDVGYLTRILATVGWVEGGGEGTIARAEPLSETKPSVPLALSVYVPSGTFWNAKRPEASAVV